MIRNRNTYLTSSVQDTKGKGELIATASQSKHYKQKAKRTVALKNGEIVIYHSYIHSLTLMFGEIVNNAVSALILFSFV